MMGLWINQYLFGINGHLERPDLLWDEPQTLPGMKVYAKLFQAETTDGVGVDILRLNVPVNADTEVFISAHVMAKAMGDGKAYARYGYAMFSHHGADDLALVAEHKDDPLQSSGYGWPGMVFSTDSDTLVSMGVEAGAGAGIVRWTGTIWWMIRAPA